MKGIERVGNFSSLQRCQKRKDLDLGNGKRFRADPRKMFFIQTMAGILVHGS